MEAMTKCKLNHKVNKKKWIIPLTLSSLEDESCTVELQKKFCPDEAFHGQHVHRFPDNRIKQNKSY